MKMKRQGSLILKRRGSPVSTASTYQVQADGYREENGRVGPNNNHNLCIKKVLPVKLVDEEFIMEEISSNTVESVYGHQSANANVTLSRPFSLR